MKDSVARDALVIPADRGSKLHPLYRSLPVRGCDLDARVFNLFAFQEVGAARLTMVALRSI